MKINSLYVTVHDRNRAKQFYSKLFNCDPFLENHTFVFFDVNGFTFGLFDYQNADEIKTMGKKVIMGNNCVPNIQVDNIKETYERIKNSAEIVKPLTKASSKHLVFYCKDTEGNLIEFYEEI
jgi:predicted enzyme related to lactoylglutathione lyase